MYKFILLFFCAMIGLGCQTTQTQKQGKPKKLYVIVNKANPSQEVTAKELKKIYLGKKQRWNKDSLPVRKYDYPPAQQAFYEQVLKMPLIEVNRYWEREKIMAGKQRPSTIKRAREIFPRLKKEIGGICYVTTKNLPKYVKIIAEFDIIQ